MEGVNEVSDFSIIRLGPVVRIDHEGFAVINPVLHDKADLRVIERPNESKFQSASSSTRWGNLSLEPPMLQDRDDGLAAKDDALSRTVYRGVPSAWHMTDF